MAAVHGRQSCRFVEPAGFVHAPPPNQRKTPHKAGFFAGMAEREVPSRGDLSV